MQLLPDVGEWELTIDGNTGAFVYVEHDNEDGVQFKNWGGLHMYRVCTQ